MGMESFATGPSYWYWEPACYRKTLAWVKRHWTLSLHFILATAVIGIALSFWSIRVSPPAQLAFAQAKSNPIAASILGSPVRQGFFVTGMVDHLRSGQYADVQMNLYGPSGQGKLYGNAVKMNDVWQLTTLELAVDGRPGRVNLLPIQSTIPR
jgi:hypothetical protein